jgi:hypothetical protein
MAEPESSPPRPSSDEERSHEERSKPRPSTRDLVIQSLLYGPKPTEDKRPGT